MDEPDATATPEAPTSTAPADPGSTQSPTPAPTDTPSPQPTVVVNVPDGHDYTTQLDGLHNDAQVGIALLLVLSCLVAAAVGAYFVRLAWGSRS